DARGTNQSCRIPRMPSPLPTLILVYEPEQACLDRLATDGFAPDRAVEIASYLAQSTDLAPEFGALTDACGRHGIAFRPVPLDEAAGVLAEAAGTNALVWTLTDGIAYFRGGAAPALTRLN